MGRFARLCAWGAVALSALAMQGCPPNYVKEDRTDRRARVLAVTDLKGGTCWDTLVRDGTWYIAANTRIQALRAQDGVLLDEIEPIPPGEGGAIVSLCFHNGDLYAVSDRSSVIRVDARDPRDLIVLESAGTAALGGVAPEHVTSVDGELWVAGEGGVVRVSDGAHFLTGQGGVGAVSPAPGGPVASVGRQILRVRDAKYLGAATRIGAAPDWAGVPGGSLFILQGTKHASVGILGPDMKEVSASALEGVVTAVDAAEGRLWAATPNALYSWSLKDGKLGERLRFPLKGAVDIDWAGPNHLAVVGSFGRALYRVNGDREGPADSFFAVSRGPGRIDAAFGDRRRILATSPEGTWEYLVGGECKLTDKPMSLATIARESVDGAWGVATIADGPLGPRTVIRIAGNEGAQTVDCRGETINNMEVVEGDLWVAHERGIEVFRQGQQGLSSVASLAIPGQVVWIYPRVVSGGAGFATRVGGVGLCEWVVGEELAAQRAKRESAPRASAQ